MPVTGGGWPPIAPDGSHSRARSQCWSAFWPSMTGPSRGPCFPPSARIWRAPTRRWGPLPCLLPGQLGRAPGPAPMEAHRPCPLRAFPPWNRCRRLPAWPSTPPYPRRTYEGSADRDVPRGAARGPTTARREPQPWLRSINPTNCRTRTRSCRSTSGPRRSHARRSRQPDRPPRRRSGLSGERCPGRSTRLTSTIRSDIHEAPEDRRPSTHHDRVVPPEVDPDAMAVAVARRRPVSGVAPRPRLPGDREARRRVPIAIGDGRGPSSAARAGRQCGAPGDRQRI